MKTTLMAMLTILALASSSMIYAQGRGAMGGKGGGQMMGAEDGMHHQMGMKEGGGEPLARIQKFLDNPKIPAATKEQILSEFKKFSEETFTLRLKHEETLYKWRKERMEKQHMARLEKIKEQNELKNSLNLSSPDSLKEFSEKMKAYREESMEKRHGMREEQHQEMIKMKEGFKSSMKEKADNFRQKVKELVKNSKA